MEPLPRTSARALLSVWLSIACVLFLAGCVGVSVSLTFAPDEPTRPVTFRSDAGRFTVDTPARFTETIKTIENPNLGPIEVHFFLATTADGVQYGVVYGDWPQSFVRAADLDLIYRDAVAGDLAATKGTLVSENDVTFDGHPANDHVLTASRGTYRFVSVAVGSRLYSVSTIGTLDQQRAADISTFFDSFHADLP